jgi:hypothetical protein
MGMVRCRRPACGSRDSESTDSREEGVAEDSVHFRGAVEFGYALVELHLREEPSRQGGFPDALDHGLEGLLRESFDRGCREEIRPSFFRDPGSLPPDPQRRRRTGRTKLGESGSFLG